jgi:surface antigen
MRTFQTASNEYCREFQQTVVIGGEEEQAHGTACRQSNGSWRIVN